MEDVEFITAPENDNLKNENRFYSYLKYSTLIPWLVKKRIFSSEYTAARFLIIIISIFFLLSIIFFIFGVSTQ